MPLKNDSVRTNAITSITTRSDKAAMVIFRPLLLRTVVAFVGLAPAASMSIGAATLRRRFAGLVAGSSSCASL